MLLVWMQHLQIDILVRKTGSPPNTGVSLSFVSPSLHPPPCKMGINIDPLKGVRRI